jgi:hypothetical protein
MGWRELSEAVFRQFLLQSPQERLAVAGYGLDPDGVDVVE